MAARLAVSGIQLSSSKAIPPVLSSSASSSGAIKFEIVCRPSSFVNSLTEVDHKEAEHQLRIDVKLGQRHAPVIGRQPAVNCGVLVEHCLSALGDAVPNDHDISSTGQAADRQIWLRIASRAVDQFPQDIEV